MAREDTQFPRKRRKTGGRARGTPNRATAEGRDFAEQLVTDPVYRENLRARLLAGRVHPGVEQRLWHYAHGKPREQLELSSSISARDVATMSTDELLAELEAHHHATAEFLSQHSARGTHSQGEE